MNDINSLPPVPQSVIDAMQREADKKFGKVAGLDQTPPSTQMNPLLQHREEFVEPESQDYPEIMESESDTSGNEVVKQAQQAQPTMQEPETEQARNFKAIKERARQAERERDDALRVVKELSEKHKAENPYYSSPVSEPDDLNINPDDLVEGKHLQRMKEKFKKIESQLQENQYNTYLASTELKLKAQYPDLEKVLTPDNIETFKLAYPELASTVSSTSDYYNKAVSAYTMIKKFGIYQEEGNSHEKQVVQKNLAKPKPLASVSPQQGDSPLSRANAFANGLTKDLKDQLFKEMADARKGY